MGSRKKISADARKEEKKKMVMARLNNYPTSPRKMRLIADLIRGVDVKHALDILKYTEKAQAKTLEKLLLSAIANWQVKNEGVRIEDANLYVKEIFVDSATMLKRLRPAPQGRGYRIRKRSNHVTLILGSNNSQTQNQEA
ncbi:MAG TPA: 50S ribosomal protein L22 [Bacteroidales bacterium]|jgi:large subunit ribosomal protein L22|nr:50S ribosomal protein L22 [Bacteroidales bacterium]HOU99267.1 50S ribosomal protein L22 [Bacteroidales bacterium]